MKMLVVIAFAMLAANFGTEAARRIPLIERQEIRDDSGQYSLKYATGNGISFTEQGALKSIDGSPALVQTGAYSYIGTDGRTYTVRYTADENGFQPIGDHIPRPNF